MKATLETVKTYAFSQKLWGILVLVSILLRNAWYPSLLVNHNPGRAYLLVGEAAVVLMFAISMYRNNGLSRKAVSVVTAILILGVTAQVIYIFTHP